MNQPYALQPLKHASTVGIQLSKGLSSVAVQFPQCGHVKQDHLKLTTGESTPRYRRVRVRQSAHTEGLEDAVSSRGSKAFHVQTQVCYKHFEARSATNDVSQKIDISETLLVASTANPLVPSRTGTQVLALALNLRSGRNYNLRYNVLRTL